MKKKRTLLAILFSVLMVMLPLSAFASASSDWFASVDSKGHTIAIANFADKKLTLDDELYVSIKERDANGADITEQEILFYDFGLPFGNYVIKQAVADSKVQNGHEITFTIYKDKATYESNPNQYLHVLDKDTGIRIEGDSPRNNKLIIRKDAVGSIRGEVYAVFRARKYLYTQNGEDEYQELELAGPMIVADRVIDEVSDWDAIKEYAHAAHSNNSDDKNAYYNLSGPLVINNKPYYRYYTGYYVLAADINCALGNTNIGGYDTTLDQSDIDNGIIKLTDADSGELAGLAGKFIGQYGMTVNSVFDGRGHTLSNVIVKNYAGGMFGLMKNTTIKNLNIVNATCYTLGSVVATTVAALDTTEQGWFMNKDNYPNLNVDANGNKLTNSNVIENVMVYGTLGNASQTSTPRALIVGKGEAVTMRNCVAILDDHRLPQGINYDTDANRGLLVKGASATQKDKTSLTATTGGAAATAGILAAYANANSTVENCLAINLKVGPYANTWVPGINEYYQGIEGSSFNTSNKYSSRLRCPESVSGLIGNVANATAVNGEKLKYGGWYTYQGINTPSIFCGVTANRFTNVGNTVHTIQGWDAYALWYKQYSGSAIINHLKETGNYYEYDIDGDGEKEVLPMAKGDFARSYFNKNVSAARTFVRDGATVVRDEQYIIANDVPWSIGRQNRYVLGSGGGNAEDYVIGGDENYTYDDVIGAGSTNDEKSYNGQHVYRDWYTIYRAETYVRLNDWKGEDGNNNPHAQAIAVSTILDQYYEAKAEVDAGKAITVKNMQAGVGVWVDIWEGYANFASDPYQLIGAYIAGTVGGTTYYMPKSVMYGRFLEISSVNRGSKAKIKATCMLDYTADADDELNVFIVDNCVNDDRDLVTAIGNYIVDAQQEELHTDGSGNATVLVYSNSITFNLDKTYAIPPVAGDGTDVNGDGVVNNLDDGVDYRYHDGLLVYNSAIDGLTAQDVYFVHGTTGVKTQLSFDWYDGNLTVYDKARTNLWSYSNDHTLFNLNNAGENKGHYLLVRFYHRFNEQRTTAGETVVDALVEIKLPITIASKIFTTKEELATMQKYMLREKIGVYAAQNCVELTDWTKDANGVPTKKTGKNVYLNLATLTNSTFYDGYYVLGNDIDMQGNATQVGWTWGATTWCINGYYVDNINGTWYCCTKSYGGKDLKPNETLANGWSDVAGAGFTGVFDGRGYVIKNPAITINAGMFGNLGVGGVIKNVAFVDASIGNNSGFLAQRHNGHYENVYVLVKNIGTGTGSTNNQWGVFASSFQGTSATLKNCFVQMKPELNRDYSGYVDAVSDANNDKIVDGTPTAYIDSSVFGMRSEGFVGTSGRCEGFFAVSKGLRPWTNDKLSMGWSGAAAVTMYAYKHTARQENIVTSGIAIVNYTRESLRKSLYDEVGADTTTTKYPIVLKDGTRYESFTNGNGTGYFDKCWDHNFWTLDSDGLPIPIRVGQNTVQDAVRFQDLAIGETTSVAFADGFYSDMVVSYEVTDVQPPVPDGAVSIDEYGNITLTDDVPVGTKITVKCTLITEAVVTLNFEAQDITLYHAEDYLIDKKSANYEIDLTNINLKDDGGKASIDLTGQTPEIRDLYVGDSKLIEGDDYTFNATTGRITILKAAYKDYKHEFICTIKNGKLTRVQADLYFYDMLIEDADDIDSFIADSQKRLGGVQNKTWLGTYILGNDIEYNADVYAPGHRTYPAVMEGYPLSATRNSTGAVGFGGTFDGRGFTIDGLHIDKYRGALFGALAEGGAVRNVNFINARLSTLDSSLLSAGPGAGAIENIYIHVYCDDAANIVLQEDNYAQSKVNRVFIDAKQRGNSSLYVQRHYNFDYGTCDVFTVGEILSMSYLHGSTGSITDNWAIYKTYDDVINGNSIDSRNVTGAYDFNKWVGPTDGYWKVVNGLPVSSRFYKDHVVGKSVQYTYPESTVALNSTNQIESKDDFYTNYRSEKGHTIANRKITVGAERESFYLITESVIGGLSARHKVNPAEFVNYQSAGALDEYVMTDGSSNEIVVKMFNHIYAPENGVGEYDVVVMREELLKISSAFHQTRALNDYTYYGAEGYIENGYTHKEVLVLDKTKLGGVDYGEVIVTVPYYIYTPGTTFNANGEIVTGSLKKVLNLNLQIDLITAQIATASDLNNFWNYATSVNENVLISNGRNLMYGGYFVLVDNVIYDQTWDTRCSWTEANKTMWTKDYGFKGIFDGRGYVIDGMRFDTLKSDGDGDEGVSGIFGLIGTNSVVRNLAIVNAEMNASGSIFASVSDGTFENIYVHLSWFTGYGTSSNSTGVFSASGRGSKDEPNLKIKNCFVEASPRTNGTLNNNFFTAESTFHINNAGASNYAYMYYSYSSVLGRIYGSAMENVLVINAGVNDYASFYNKNTAIPVMFQDAGRRHGNNLHGMSPWAGQYALNWATESKNYDFNHVNSISFTYRNSSDSLLQKGNAYVYNGVEYYAGDGVNAAERAHATSDVDWEKKGVDRNEFVSIFTNDESGVWTLDKSEGDEGRLPIFKQLAFNGETLTVGRVQVGETHTLGLSNKVLGRMATWSIVSGGATVNGNQLTVNSGGEIVIRATTRYGYKDFTLTVYSPGYVYYAEQEMNGVDATTTYSIPQTKGTITSITLGGKAITGYTYTAGQSIVIPKAQYPTAFGKYELKIVTNDGGNSVATIIPVEYATMLISNKADLLRFATLSRGNTWGVGELYVLNADIDMEGAEYSINVDVSGVNDYTGNGFAGTFDGRGHIISNIHITNNGFISGVRKDGVLKNISFINAIQSASGFICRADPTQGSWANSNCGLIENIYVQVESRIDKAALFAYGNYGDSRWNNIVVDVTAKAGTYHFVSNCYHKNYGAFNSVYGVNVDGINGGTQGQTSASVDETQVFANFAAFKAGGNDFNGAAINYNVMDNDFWDIVNGVPVPVRFKSYEPTITNTQTTNIPLNETFTITGNGGAYSTYSLTSAVEGVTLNGRKVTVTDAGAGKSFTVRVTNQATGVYTEKKFTIIPLQTLNLVGDIDKIDASTSFKLIDGITGEGYTQLALSFNGDEPTSYTLENDTITLNSETYASLANKYKGADGVDNYYTLNLRARTANSEYLVNGKIYVADMVITSKAELDEFSQLSRSALWGEGKTYVLGADIDYEGATYSININTNGSNYVTHSTTGATGVGFAGTFDGCGRIISNITIGTNGFISGIRSDGELKNISFVKATQTGTGFIGQASGDAVSQGGKITDIYAQLTATSTAKAFFGGFNYGSCKVTRVVVDVVNKVNPYYFFSGQINANYSVQHLYGINVDDGKKTVTIDYKGTGTEEQGIANANRVWNNVSQNVTKVNDYTLAVTSGLSLLAAKNPGTTVDKYAMFSDYASFKAGGKDYYGNTINYSVFDNAFWDIVDGVPVSVGYKNMTPVITNDEELPVGTTVLTNDGGYPHDGTYAIYAGINGVTLNGDTLTIGDIAQGKKFIVSYTSNLTGKQTLKEFTVKSSIVKQPLGNYINVNDLTSSSLTNGTFYTHDLGLTTPTGTQRSYYYYGVGGQSGAINNINSSENDFEFNTGGAAIAQGVFGTEYYLEGVFDSTTTAYKFQDGFVGLLIATGPQWILGDNIPEGTRLQVGVLGNQILTCASFGWGANQNGTFSGTEAQVLGDWTTKFTAQELSAIDRTALKLGVLRYGSNNFAFFINDRFIATKNFASVNVSSSGTESFGNSAIGVVSTYTQASRLYSTTTILDFKYTTSRATLDALRLKVPQGKSIDLYLIAGQSNAAGNAVFNVNTMRSKDRTLVDGNENVLISATSTGNKLTNVKAGYGEGSNKIGAEAGMANYFTSLSVGSGEDLQLTYDASEGRYAGVIKTAVGGTGFEYEGENDWMKNAGWWGSPTWNSRKGYSIASSARNLYSEFVNNIVNTVNTLKADGFENITIKGLFWMQGEKHINSWGQSGANTSNNYYIAFNDFASDLRSELNTKIGATINQNLNQLNILIGEVAETFGIDSASYTVAKNQNFIALQRYIATQVPYCETISFSAYPLVKDNGNGSYTILGSDNYHWGEDAMFNIGKMVGESLRNF